MPLESPNPSIPCFFRDSQFSFVLPARRPRSCPLLFPVHSLSVPLGVVVSCMCPALPYPGLHVLSATSFHSLSLQLPAHHQRCVVVFRLRVSLFHFSPCSPCHLHYDQTATATCRCRLSALVPFLSCMLVSYVVLVPGYISARIPLKLVLKCLLTKNPSTTAKDKQQSDTNTNDRQRHNA